MNIYKKLLLGLVMVATLGTWIVFGWPNGPQSGPSSPASATPDFEVASVRVIPAGTRVCTPASRSGCLSVSPSGAATFTARNVSLAILVSLAFGVDSNRISGAPLGSKAYDVLTKPEGDGGRTYEQLRLPLQHLLQERFHLTCHEETKNFPGYALVVAKGGPKLHASKGGSDAYIMREELLLQNVAMSNLAATLSFPLKCPVVDKTGLNGNYDIKLDFAPDDDTDSPLPSIFTALRETLGLKLEKAKVPVETLVIDHVDQVPTEN